MLLTNPHDPRFGTFAVTFDQLLPPSRVTLTVPSLLPVQMTPRSIGDSSIAMSVHGTSCVSGHNPGGICCLLLSFVVRSGLMTDHVRPPSADSCTNWLPA